MTGTTLSPPKRAPASPYRVKPAVDTPPRTVEKAEPPSAKVRLEASRARVRSALMEIAHPPKRPNAGWFNKLTGMVEDIPGVSLAIDTAKSWLHEHRDTAQAAGQATQVLVTPIAQRHPESLLGAAAVVGALVVLLRPWRLLLRRSVLFGAASLMASQAMRSRSAGQWLHMLTKSVTKKTRA